MSRRYPAQTNDDLLRGACPQCEGWGYIEWVTCDACDGTGFRPDAASHSTGYGRRRLVFWPWHYVQHVRRGRVNSWRSALFCTFCVDDRMRDFYTEASEAQRVAP